LAESEDPLILTQVDLWMDGCPSMSYRMERGGAWKKVAVRLNVHRK
jgi:hypothetical protein